MKASNYLAVVRPDNNMFNGQHPNERTQSYLGKQIYFNVYRITKRNSGGSPSEMKNIGRICRVNVCFNGRNPMSTRFNHLKPGNVIYGFRFISKQTIISKGLNCDPDSLIIDTYSKDLLEQDSVIGIKII